MKTKETDWNDKDTQLKDNSLSLLKYTLFCLNRGKIHEIPTDKIEILISKLEVDLYGNGYYTIRLKKENKI
jgi:hypothetical protein